MTACAFFLYQLCGLLGVLPWITGNTPVTPPPKKNKKVYIYRNKCVLLQDADKTILTNNTNLYKLTPVLHRGRTTIKHERMDNIWVADMSVNEHKIAWVVRQFKMAIKLSMQM